MLATFHGLARIELHHAALGDERDERGDAELGRLLHDPVHALAPRDALCERDAQRRFTLDLASCADPHAQVRAAALDDRRRVFATPAVEDGELGADPESQHTRDMCGCRGSETLLAAALERLLHEDARQAHVARSMPSRATSTINRISSSAI